jgi:hypothetical protein
MHSVLHGMHSATAREVAVTATMRICCCTFVRMHQYTRCKRDAVPQALCWLLNITVAIVCGLMYRVLTDGVLGC